MCEGMERTTAATVVDHIEPHKGDVDLFYDSDNTQSLCKHCHDSIKQAHERGRNIAVDADGWPMGGRGK